MANLNERELAMLSSFMYCDDVVQRGRGKDLFNFVRNLLEKTDRQLSQLTISGDIGNLTETIKEEVNDAIENCISYYYREYQQIYIDKNELYKAASYVQYRDAILKVEDTIREIAKEAIEKACKKIDFALNEEAKEEIIKIIFAEIVEKCKTVG